MAAVALLLYLLYVLLAFGVRTALHHRRTGSTGFRGLSGRPGSAPWWGGVLFAAALAAGLLGPLSQVAGVLHPLAALDHRALDVVGVVITVAGIAATLAAQHAMGTAWRVGVDPDEPTALVTDGVFAHVRNPVFTAMIATGAGLALTAADPVSLSALPALVVAVHLQVRAVEEPHLLARHGGTYRDYTARTGRFLPRWAGLGAPSSET
ncbi:isoprenylcysteine carboxylmethyltransferase family protein [Actinosynnema sp. NPDC023587]|uniref:methyltransferase family protein n=1 Tax=Actinosynnema sp. NPDC023587 TaxID=3154695 RepID=UPI0033DF004F